MFFISITFLLLHWKCIFLEMWFKTYMEKKPKQTHLKSDKGVEYKFDPSVFWSWGQQGKQRWASRKILLGLVGSVAQLQAMKRNMVCWQEEKAHVFLQLVTILSRIVCVCIDHKQWAFSYLFRTE